MKYFRRFCALFFSGLLTIFCAEAQSGTIPFSVGLQDVSWSGWPGLHSFAFGQWDGRWIMMTGRTNGLHDIIPPNQFPVSQSNQNIFMLDPNTGEQWNRSIYELPLDMASQLRSTNAEYIQIGKYLYIAGGYGEDSATQQFITYPSLIAVDLDLLSNAIATSSDINPAFRKINDSLFQVTGGNLGMLDSTLYLFGGHIFTGAYTHPATPSFTQVYTNELRKFKLQDDGSAISITDIEKIKDTINFHRRDLNFIPVILPGGTFALGAYAGVFQYASDVPFYDRIYFTAAGYFEDATLSQKINDYTCPVMSIYDSVSQNYYATFFGGISQDFYDETNDTLMEDLNIPFVNDISVVTRDASGTNTQQLLPIHFDDLLGSNAIFVLNDAVSHYDNGVIKLKMIDGDTTAGFIYGGIQADFPDFTTSTASPRLFKVILHYASPDTASGIMSKNVSVNIFPNPAHDHITIRNDASQPLLSAALMNYLGEEIKSVQLNMHYGETQTISTQNLPSGFYFIRLNYGSSYLVKKIIIE